MARFYGKFDSGSGGWVTEIENNFFARSRIGADSASGASLRNGLIASRSALSVDIYEDLDANNKDGSKGIYFPPDSGPFSTNSSTFVSWSTAYTSSVNGIRTPTTNSYGSPTVVNYSLRPTASILSTQTTLVGPSNPTDPVGASYTTYVNASAAVTAVLNAIQRGSTVSPTFTTPFTRLGNFPSRTLHSIWHDPNLQYFAWDDFTPGTPQSVGAAAQQQGNAVTIDISWNPGEFPNDANGTVLITGTITRQGGGVTPVDLYVELPASPTTYTWNAGTFTTAGTYDLTLTLSFGDPIIPESRGGLANYTELGAFAV
jgi:hypothetical protein